jgi:superfamily I DNA and/or RNA helicase
MASHRAEVAETVKLLGETDGSIGLVSPFRAQAEAIEEAIIERYSADEILRRRLKVGTAHAMQGSEHDTVIISLAVDAAAMTGRRFIEDRNLFNTMITRARNHQIVLMSFDEADLKPGLLLDYVRHADRPPNPDWKMALRGGWAGQLGEEL